MGTWTTNAIAYSQKCDKYGRIGSTEESERSERLGGPYMDDLNDLRFFRFYVVSISAGSAGLCKMNLNHRPVLQRQRREVQKMFLKLQCLIKHHSRHLVSCEVERYIFLHIEWLNHNNNHLSLEWFKQPSRRICSEKIQNSNPQISHDQSQMRLNIEEPQDPLNERTNCWTKQMHQTRRQNQTQLRSVRTEMQ